jgi:hypothetical protein
MPAMANIGEKFSNERQGEPNRNFMRLSEQSLEFVSLSKKQAETFYFFLFNKTD